MRTNKSRLRSAFFLVSILVTLLWFSRGGSRLFTFHQLETYVIPVMRGCREDTDEFKVLFVRGGHFGEKAVLLLLKSALPGISIFMTTEAKEQEVYNLIIEGPPQFSSLSDCGPNEIPWAQFIAEPGSSYDTLEWCGHNHPPIFRMDTSLKQRASVLPETTFIWCPYASVIAEEYLKDALERNIVLTDWSTRPHFAAWIASNCDSQARTVALREMLNISSQLNPRGGFHSLGSCLPNTEIKIPPRESGWLPVVQIYENYRFVMAFENSIEPGYVTEKLVTSLAAGAVPVYYGDSAAARLIFPRSPFVDVQKILSLLHESNNTSAPTPEDWVSVFKFLIQLDEDRTSMEKFMTTAIESDAYQTIESPFPTERLTRKVREELVTKLSRDFSCARLQPGVQ